jgi:multiple sugar transport system substrate-binding protein
MRTIKRTFPSQLLVPLAVITLLAVAVATGGRKTQDAQGRPTVVYAHPPCPPDLMAYFEQAFTDFREQHPEIDFRVLHITGNYEDKIKIMFAGKVAPDVIFMYPTALPAWVELNALAPLDDLMAADGKVTKDDYFRAGVETFSWNGKTYGLPKDASAEIVFYNKAMFIERGVPLPTADWTWDDYLAAAQKLTRDTDGDGRIDIFGARQPAWDSMVIQNGGKVISDDGMRCLLDEPRAIEALTRWAALRNIHQVTPTPESTMDTSNWRLFALQRLGMFISMYPAVPILRRSCDFEWDIALPPRGPAKPYSAFMGSALAITRQSRNKQAAYTFARWMTSNGMRHVMTFDIPSYKPLGQSDQWRDADQPPASKQIAIDVMAQSGPPSIKHPDWAQIKDAIEPHLDRVNRGVSTVEEAVEQIVPQVNAILARRAAMAPSEAR